MVDDGKVMTTGDAACEVSNGRLVRVLIAKLGGVVEVSGAELLHCDALGEVKATAHARRGVVRYALVGGEDVEAWLRRVRRGVPALGERLRAGEKHAGGCAPPAPPAPALGRD